MIYVVVYCYSFKSLRKKCIELQHNKKKVKSLLFYNQICKKKLDIWIALKNTYMLN